MFKLNWILLMILVSEGLVSSLVNRNCFIIFAQLSILTSLIMYKKERYSREATAF